MSKRKIFVGQRDGEKVLWIINKHPWLALYPMSKGGIAFLFFLFLPLFFTGLKSLLFTSRWLTFIYLGLLFFLGLYIIYQFLIWQGDRIIVTTERLIDFSLKGLIHREVKEVGLDQIVNISSEVKGLLGSLLGYGSVIVRSQVGDFVLDFVPRPTGVQSWLKGLVDEVNKTPAVTVEELVEFIKMHRI